MSAAMLSASLHLKTIINQNIEYFYEASLVAQTIKRLPAMRETRVQPLGQKDLLEKEMATHSSILAWLATVHGVAKSQTRLSDFTFASN